MKDNQDAGGALSPELFLRLMEAARAAVPAEDRYRDAGTLAWKITRLRQERERLGFENESLETYIARLAARLAIDPHPVLEWFGIVRVTLDGPLKAICSFGRELGIAKEDLIAYLTRGLADERNIPVPVAARGDFPNGQTFAEHCFSVLESRAWNPEDRAKLKRMRREIDHEYGEGDS